MFQVLAWWLLIELIGIAVLPVAFRFFRNLPDRGYAFIKPLGLLLIAYPFWLLTSLGFLTNTRGAIALVAVGVAALAWWFAGRKTNDEGPMTKDERSSFVLRPPSLVEWLRANASLILTTELVFTLAFFAWALVRAYMPEITATEKPMDFAFLNGILQSERFPPLDPWLSGYAISYYYFGYLVTAMLTLLSGVPSSYAFNLMIALLFALAATGAFGLAYNLIRDWRLEIRDFRSPISNVQSPISNLQSLFFALFAPIFLVLIGNLEGFFEALHAKGFGTPEFWQWLDVKGLANAPVTGTFVPMDNWWWWRASRVIHDVVLGQTQEVIDEFPQFSFLLGDMHPHVLALPFVLLALAVALNLLKFKDSRFKVLTFDFLLLPLILGGLFFFNSWDILPYGFILIAAFAVARYRASNAWTRDTTRDLAVFVVTLGALSVILYLPFYLGFQSQAGGILPTLFVKTRLHQYLIMFGLFVFILSTFCARLVFERRTISALEWLNRALTPLTAIVAFPLLVMALALVIVAASPHLREQARAAFPIAADNFLAAVVLAYFKPLVSDLSLFVVLAILLAMIFILGREYLLEDSTLFTLLLAFTGFLLTFSVEFVYLRDQFGTRMNTVFKFYFQTWTLFSIASAYAVFYVARHRPKQVENDKRQKTKDRGFCLWSFVLRLSRALWFIAFAVLLGASLIYPALAIPSRANDFAKPPTLDGIAWIRESNPDDYAAIEWLRANAPRGAVILEAPGGEYSYGNRISMATGLPTVLGWAGHESQWRGGSKFFKDDAAGIDRAADVQRIYQTIDPKEVLTYLDKYAIKFVVVGREEKNMYGLTKTQIEKFGRVMTLVFENGDVRIYGR